MVKKYYPIQSYREILSFHMQKDTYLGTGDNNDIVFLSIYPESCYIIIKTYDCYLCSIIITI